MTQRQFCKRVDYWLSHPDLIWLGIAHWNIEVEFVDELERAGSVASVECNRDYDEAGLTVVKTVLERDAFFIDYVIVHELIHVVMRDLDVVYNDMLDTLSPSAQEAYALRGSHVGERFVDRLARAVVALADTSE